MEEENRECAFPEELKKLYKVLFLGKQKTYIDSNRRVHTIYEYSDELNGDNKGQDMKEEMLKFLDEGQIPMYQEEKDLIKEFIETFFSYYQPERSKREDSVLKNIPEYESQSSLNFEEWQRRCGALNTEETRVREVQ